MTATTAITTTGSPHRPLLPLASLALAGAALTVSLIAINTDDEPASNVVTQAPARPPAGAVASASLDGNATGDCLARVVIVRC